MIKLREDLRRASSSRVQSLSVMLIEGFSFSNRLTSAGGGRGGAGRGGGGRLGSVIVTCGLAMDSRANSSKLSTFGRTASTNVVLKGSSSSTGVSSSVSIPWISNTGSEKKIKCQKVTDLSKV